MEIRVTGYEGRLGSELILCGAKPFDCDITKPKAIEFEMQDKMPDVIINCAAYTNVDGAVTNYEEAIDVNYKGVQNLLNAIDIYNPTCRFIQISTDYVFSGMDGPYKENSPRDQAVNDYGLTKQAAEMLVASWEWGRWNIVRTTGLFGARNVRNDFVTTVTDALYIEREIHVTNTLYGNQTYTPYLASQLMQLAQMEDAPRILNLGSQDVITRYDFALMIANLFGFDPNLITPVKSTEIKSWVAKRPTKGGLDVRLANRLGFPKYTALDGLTDMLENWN